jgi:hypothetical protein
VLVDVTIDCALWGTEFSVVRGAGDAGFVAFTAYAPAHGIRLVRVDDDGAISTLAGPMGARRVFVLADSTGAPHIATSENPDRRCAFFRLEGGEWWREPITAPPSSAGTYSMVYDARFTPDGRVVVALLDNDAPWLVTRDPSGTWAREMVPGGQPWMSLAIDAIARSHVLFVSVEPAGSPLGIVDWVSGVGTTMLWSTFSEAKSPIDAAPVGERAAVSLPTKESLHVILPEASGGASDHTVPATPYLAVTGCPPLPTPVGAPTNWEATCTETGSGVYAQALAANADGLWIAYFWQNIDRDVRQACGQGEGGVGCYQTTTDDRSTGEVVLATIPRGATPADPRVVWRAPVNGSPGWPPVSLDGSGSRLTLAAAVGASNPITIHYWTIDTGKL